MKTAAKRYILQQGKSEYYLGYVSFGSGARFTFKLRITPAVPVPSLISVNARGQDADLTEREEAFFMRTIKDFAAKFFWDRRRGKATSGSRHEAFAVDSGRIPKKFVDAIFA